MVLLLRGVVVSRGFLVACFLGFGLMVWFEVGLDIGFVAVSVAFIGMYFCIAGFIVWFGVCLICGLMVDLGFIDSVGICVVGGLSSVVW